MIDPLAANPTYTPKKGWFTAFGMQPAIVALVAIGLGIAAMGVSVLDKSPPATNGQIAFAEHQKEIGWHYSTRYDAINQKSIPLSTKISSAGTGLGEGAATIIFQGTENGGVEIGIQSDLISCYGSCSIRYRIGDKVETWLAHGSSGYIVVDYPHEVFAEIQNATSIVMEVQGTQFAFMMNGFEWPAAYTPKPDPA